MADPRSLTALGLAHDPISDPLSYPGAVPDESGVLASGRYLRLHPVEGRELGQWRVEAPDGPSALDDVLAASAAAPVERRHPVLAVGSNAAPAQLTRKFGQRGLSTVVPMVLGRVHGISSGVSAHVNRHGYIPSAPIVTPGESHEMFLLWLDDEQLAVLDATEPNYRRARLGRAFPVELPTGQRVRACDLYVSRWGCLLDGDGRPRRLGDQRELITDLLAGSAELNALLGDTPESFAKAAADDERRKKARLLFAAEKRVQPQPELERTLAHSG